MSTVAKSSSQPLYLRRRIVNVEIGRASCRERV